MTTAKEMTERFIADGWNKDIILTELTKEEIKEKNLNTNKQYFRMNKTGNIYHSSGKIALFNL